MRWGRKHQPKPQNQHQSPKETPQEEEKESKNKNKSFSFSPLSWLSKLTARPNKPTGAKNTPAPASCLPKRASPVSNTQVPPIPARFSPAAAAVADVVPRRLSVGNDNADADDACGHYRRRLLLRQSTRHYSLGGDRDLPPLGHLIPFSRAASPQPPPPTTSPSDTDVEEQPRHRRRRRRRAEQRGGGGGGRRSFSGRMPARVRMRSPRRAAAAASDLEKFAVVRRTRDPQKEFRQSMVEMIASKGIGRPEELERLLACYLSLNADEHHDCIIKVFRQVWFEINPGRIGARRGVDSKDI